MCGSILKKILMDNGKGHSQRPKDKGKGKVNQPSAWGFQVIKKKERRYNDKKKEK